MRQFLLTAIGECKIVDWEDVRVEGWHLRQGALLAGGGLFEKLSTRRTGSVHNGRYNYALHVCQSLYRCVESWNDSFKRV